MKHNKLISLLLAILPLLTITPPLYAKKIYPAEIVGRDLNYPGLGWLGHVGIATTDMTSPQGMVKNADQVIEILNENPVGQINTISNFKSRSNYWGSKYGVADRGIVGYQVLVEANHQRWWCPKYTSDTKYHIGVGSPTTGQVIECGTWRCDTYVWWAFYSQGLDTMPGRIWLPRKVFNYFPYYNDERFSIEEPEEKDETVTQDTLDNTTSEHLNSMPYEHFQKIMDAPPIHYIISTSELLMQFAYDENLNDIKRGIMIDRLIADDKEVELVKKLLKLYAKTDRVEVKDKVVQSLMLYNQRHRNSKSYVQSDQLILKSFFAMLLASEPLTSKMADDAIRGFIDTHSSEEILAARENIEKWLPQTGHYSSIMLKYTLVHKSIELQRIYMQSIVEELREANSTDLDSYLFGPLAIGYKNTGKDLLEPETKKVVLDYLGETQYKYSPEVIKMNPQDIYLETTTMYYLELVKQIGVN